MPATALPISASWPRAAWCSSSSRSCSRRAIRRSTRPPATSGHSCLAWQLGLLATSLFWLVVFGRHRRIAYRGDWPRAIRRGAWVFLVTALFVVLRLNQVFQPPIALFVLALVVFAEATLSVER